jgi:nucleoside-diphosphate-sugar epimerase
MRILLIGGNGFIGSPLVRELLASGHQLALFHRRRESPFPNAGVVHIQGDRNHLPEYTKQIQEFSPDVIVDLILSSAKQAHQLMTHAHELAPRVVAISSMDVYRAWGVLRGLEPGALEPLPITESSPLRSVRRLYTADALKIMQGVFSWLDDDYDKIAVEEPILQDSRVRGTILRLPMVYGPGDPLHRFFPLLKRFADGRTSILLADDFAAWRAPRGYVDNVAHAIALAATSEQAAGRVYNICEEPSWPDLAWQKKIAAQANWRGHFVVLPRSQTPEHLLQPGNTAQHMVVTSQRIRAELGYEEPVAVDEGIRRTVAWEKENPPPNIDPKQFDYVAWRSPQAQR